MDFVDGRGLDVSRHAWQRWLERTRPGSNQEALRRLNRCLASLQPLNPLSRSRRNRGSYYTAGGYVFVVDRQTVVTVYKLNLRQFEVIEKEPKR